MTLNEFKNSLQNSNPPETTNGLLLALWHDAKGDWHGAHNIAQDFETRDGAWVHAYLHRKEGDVANAGYWYHRAGKKFPQLNLEREWDELAAYLLQNNL